MDLSFLLAQIMMASSIIAGWANKDHFHVIREVETMLNKLGLATPHFWMDVKVTRPGGATVESSREYGGFSVEYSFNQSTGIIDI